MLLAKPARRQFDRFRSPFLGAPRLPFPEVARMSPFALNASRWFLSVGLLTACLASKAFAQAPFGGGPARTTPAEDEKVIEPPKLPEPKGAKRLVKEDEVWVDVKNGKVIVDGYVSLREGFLEMLACLAGTKEHESIIGARTKAQTVHAALLAIGAKTGHPVQFRPKFAPPTGTEIDIELQWLDEDGKWQKARAQDWIRDAKTMKSMTQPWVFAGSGFWKDDQGKDFYMAESGDFICVSNFTTAMLDIPVESSQSNEGLLFEADTKKIPPLGTPIRMVLTPKLEEKKK